MIDISSKNNINKKIFKTIKSLNKQKFKLSNRSLNLGKEMNSTVDMKKMMKLMKNRLSARKCRQKKKNYMKNLEKEILELRGELNKYKSIQANEMKMEYYINQVIHFKRNILDNLI